MIEKNETLKTIQKRILWLATNMIHHANNLRPNVDGTKVGGHQASSASMVTIMTALYFDFLKKGDLVSVKPHASPVFHSIQYLLNQISADYLPTLRQFGGLQAYPSRTKDPEKIDFSTGSVGLGAVAPLFSAYAEKYINAHFEPKPERRFVAIIGDAELDEGNIWEALLDGSLSSMSNMLLIVDLNRQSLDRVVPGIKAHRLKEMFADCDWQVIEAKYGSKLQEFFSMKDGERLRQRIDSMTNAQYQSIIRLPVEEMRSKIVENDKKLEALISQVPDDDLVDLISNLGGHDFDELLACLNQADQEKERPTVLFAYTIKGWGLPIAGHPLNHSMLLDQEQIDQVRSQLIPKQTDEWAKFEKDSAADQLTRLRAKLLYGEKSSIDHLPESKTTNLTIPAELPVSVKGSASTQQSFGRALMALSRHAELAKHIVTVSPDVSSSTNLTGWINKVGVFSPQIKDGHTQEHWEVTESGQHIELGISEMNLFMALSMLGLTGELFDQPIIPIGTVYDPFVCRGLDALIYGLYSESKFIFAGTPSGVTLSPEGGAHQSAVTSSLGMELPNLNFYEPCYSEELTWQMLEAIESCLDRENGRSAYLRLSTKPIDHTPFEEAKKRLGATRLRQQALAGGYRLHDWRESTDVYRSYLVHIAATGVMVPEALKAAQQLAEEGIPANVINLTNPRRLYETWRAGGSLDWLIPQNERFAPLVTVNDGASHAHAWLGSIFGMTGVPLGVDKFGQSGGREDLYRYVGIDTDSIVKAAFKGLSQNGL